MSGFLLRELHAWVQKAQAAKAVKPFIQFLSAHPPTRILVDRSTKPTVQQASAVLIF